MLLAASSEDDAQVFDKLSIRTKLVAMVAAPLAVIVALAALGFVQRRTEAEDSRADARRVEAIEAVQAVQHRLHLESLANVAWLSSDGQLAADQQDPTRAATDRAVADLAAAIDRLRPDEPAVDLGRAALRQMEMLDSFLRSQVDEGRVTWPWAETLYRQLEASLPTVSNSLARSIADTGVAGGAQGLVALGDHATALARVGVLAAGAATDGRFPAADDTGIDVHAQFLAAIETSDLQMSVVGTTAGPATRVRLRNQMVGGDISFFNEQVGILRVLPGNVPLSVDPARWVTAVTATLDQLQAITGTEVVDVLAAATARVDAADRAARLFLAGAVLASLLVLGLAVVVATSIARPVLSLSGAVDRVASVSLPRLVESLRNPSGDEDARLRSSFAPLEVRGGRELAQLTTSVNSIQEVALDVATEQAALLRKGIGDLFVNLARRNQALLDRQLEFIDELESREDDPDQLEHLFKLDHMATRMRRNAESLLVLAGAEGSRRRGQPVPLAKVVQAAVGEIEHFARVDLVGLDDSQVASGAAADLAHLVSELMENATQFSPPHTRVEVRGHRTTDGYSISITDQGIGMGAEQMAEANRLLAEPPALGLTLTRTLGFVVVGRLARRHGITVRLSPSPGDGVTALVLVPGTVLVAEVEQVEQVEVPPEAAGPLDPFAAWSLGDVGAGGWDDAPWATREAEDRPATFEEAVPTGPALTEGLARVVGEERVPTGGPAAPAWDAAPMPGPARPTGPVASPARAAAPGPPGSLPLPVRSRRGPTVDGHAPMVPAPPPTGPAAVPAGRPVPPSRPAAPPPPARPELTSAGLVRRTPRQDRPGPRPGATGPGRGPGTTISSRSPEEVRSMLSRFHSGQQAGRAPRTDAEPAFEARSPDPVEEH